MRAGARSWARTACVRNERSWEFHHVEPYAAGGAATAANIQLRRAHNACEASLFFGSDGSQFVREEGAHPWAVRPGAVAQLSEREAADRDSTIYNGEAPGWRNWQTLGT